MTACAVTYLGALMTLTELGAALREAREGCGYSVEEVATRLKIMARIVRAIEEGDQTSLPHPVYAKGFIRAYAALVGIDEADARKALTEMADPYEEAQPVQLAPTARQERRAFGNMLPALVVLCAIAFGVFWFRDPLAEAANQLIALMENAALPTTATPAASEPEQPQSESAPDAALRSPSSSVMPASVTPVSSSGMSVTPASAAMSSIPASPSSTLLAATSMATANSGKSVELNPDGLPAGLADPTPAAPTDSDVPGSGVAASEVATGTTPPDTTLTLQTGDTQTDLTKAGKGKHQIIMTAVAECWVHSSADGTITRQFSLKKGETFALSFESKLVVKLGNAGGVRIKYDGEELPPPGKMGQVRTITFPADVTAGNSTR